MAHEAEPEAGEEREERAPVCQLVVDDLARDRLRIDGVEARHLVKGLRARPGELFAATDGRGTRARVEVLKAHARAVELSVRERRRAEPPARRWWVATAAAGARFDWLVEKAVELGAWGLVPLLRHGESGRSARWQRVARAALGQCLGSWDLRIVPAASLTEARERGPTPGEPWAGIALADPEGVPAREFPLDRLPAGDLLLAVGPPEGFARTERSRLEQVQGLVRLRLGPLRLRSETATVAALAWIAVAGDRI